MLTFFTIPSASTVIASSSDYASALTTEFLPVVWVVLGATAAVVIGLFLRKVIGKALRQATNTGGRRMRGRRR